MEARKLMNEVCDLLEIIGLNMHDEQHHTYPDETMQHLDEVLDTIDHHVDTLSQYDMIIQYDPIDRPGLRAALDEIREFVRIHKSILQFVKDARWIERMGVK